MSAPNGRSTASFAPPTAAAGSVRLPAGALGTAVPTRQRHNGMVALIVGLAAVGGWLYSTAGSKTPVVMVLHRVPVGQLVQRSDRTTLPVSGRVVAVAGGNLTSVVGQRAAVTLLPDMLLQRSMVTSGQGRPGRRRSGWRSDPGRSRPTD